MARYTPLSSDDDYANVSVINGGVLKTIRIHEHFKFISMLSANLSGFNLEHGEYNYNIKKEVLDVLYLEVESKIKQHEREDAESLRNAIKLFMKNYPIYHKRYNGVNKTTKIEINKRNLEVLREYLYKYELVVRRLHDLYGLDTRYAEEDAY